MDPSTLKQGLTSQSLVQEAITAFFEPVQVLGQIAVFALGKVLRIFA